MVGVDGKALSCHFICWRLGVVRTAPALQMEDAGNVFRLPGESHLQSSIFNVLSTARITSLTHLPGAARASDERRSTGRQ